MHRNILIWGLCCALLSIILGAFGAHALKSLIASDHLVTFETGVRYQFMHGAGLIMLALYASQNQADNNEKSVDPARRPAAAQPGPEFF